jgi:threonine dehydratase
MADISSCLPLNRQSVQVAHACIKPHIHLTPVVTSTTLNNIASTPQSPQTLKGTEYEDEEPAKPTFELFFKCENFQKIGSFKARGAYYALSRLSEDQRKNGVITHSSGTRFTSTFIQDCDGRQAKLIHRKSLPGPCPGS